ncbi:PorT family protein [Olivibacter sp. SDN3]|uniref:porin family protein n=1 Tax=Olivibacter sp. SDN3 TaxID=2764720 RepID=UPI0016515AF6|nr:porin family protein [Olivibacter sp. SDN3]QNL48482.1 PorT family protein [Olivibacter sp. SDN3]
MKKLLLSLIAVLLTSSATFAQQEMGFGLKAGVNFPKYNFSSNGENISSTGSTTNFHVTAFLDAPIATDWFYIQPGVSLQGKGAKLSENQLGNYTQNTMWIEVPVNFVAKFPTADAGSFFLGAGPYIAFGISGKNKWESNNGGSVETDIPDFEFGGDGALKSTDFGLNFIGGFEFRNGLMIHGGYGLGLTNLATRFDGTDIKQTNRVWTVGLGFRI